jgi:serine/threonine-protein kinase HipA
MNNKCLVCSRPIDGDNEYHMGCSRRFFGTYPPPALDMTLENLQEFAALSVLSRITITGVQKKLSLGVEKKEGSARLTIVGLWGKFILKPPSDEYPFLPENEDTVMRLASLARIPVVPCALIRLKSGELSYIAKRIDRDRYGGKIAMEDFCQISQRLTEDKYKGSCENIGKLLLRFSVYPGLDVVDFFERVAFNYLVGNSDMHLKNYSLIETPAGLRLSPAYDLLSTVLALPEDSEESALTINGKKNRLRKDDFLSLAGRLSIPDAALRRILEKFHSREKEMLAVIDTGRLPPEMKTSLASLVSDRLRGI